jgi:mono/diheme cytochrome c family protein
MSGFAKGLGGRCLALLVVVVLGAACGCGGSNVDPYPISLTYPPRADMIVDKIPGDKVDNPDDPGQLDRWVANIANQPSGKVLDPNAIDASTRNAVQAELENHFGKPAAPKVEADAAAAFDKEDGAAEQTRQQTVRQEVERLQLDPKTLAEGSRQYRRHCMHCHGVPGNGRGPTGPWLNPHPRDYRQGMFKFISTDEVKVLRSEETGNPDPVPLARKPRREDLLRTLKKGIDGTSMPSFGLEDEQVLNSLVSYVIHLSIRGQTEMGVLKALLTGGMKPDEVPAKVAKEANSALLEWAKAVPAIKPPPYEYNDQDNAARLASVERGYRLFIDQKQRKCLECHVDFGRQAKFNYDDWGTMVRPRDLTAGQFRGGRRPIDIYWRVIGGIPGVGMPAHKMEHNSAAKTDEAWDLVNFVLALPYPNMLPPKVAKEIYPSLSKESTEHASLR